MPYPIKQAGLYDSSFEHDSCGVGFVCNIKGIKSHEMIEKGIEVLERLSHRGAVGADPKTGDGAGILIQLPYEYFKDEFEKEGKKIPSHEKFAAGIIFLPAGSNDRLFCEENIERLLKEQSLDFLGFKEVPVDDSAIGRTAKKTQPVIKYLFTGAGRGTASRQHFEVKLYIARKKIENFIRNSGITQKDSFYIVSLSSKTICYKGLLMPKQIKDFFPELKDKRIKSCLALVHSRYSTNTFPTWDLAQPFRFLAHNGEINTLRGNINWMNTREKLFESRVFGDDIKEILPAVVPGGSDSASFDNVFELLVVAGRSLPHVMMMLIPAVWQKNELIKKEHRDFYKYHSCMMEPWDGPAAICFTDGEIIGGILDRNGLRPCRYVITKDDFVVMASEVGVLDIPADRVVEKGKLSPGKMFLVDTVAGKIIDDKKIKDEISSRKPYGKWLEENLVHLDQIKTPSDNGKEKATDLFKLQKAAGYTREDLKFILKPMIEKGQEPIGSMGNDIPYAVLSERPQMLFSYFKQLFAQVTNPAIDPIREELVMSLESAIGPQQNLLSEGHLHCRKLNVINPILTDEELRKIKSIDVNGLKSKTISLLFDPEIAGSFKSAIDRVCNEALQVIDEGYSLLILSDKGVNKKKAAIPSLLAMGAVQHHLIRQGARSKAAIIIESMEPREVMHFALLFGFGADCVNPYLAYEVVDQIVNEEKLDVTLENAKKNFIKAIEKGILKVLSKMGISLLDSYRGAQIFEAVGLGSEVIYRYFFGTVSRIGGINTDIIEKETVMRHNSAFGQETEMQILPSGGIYQWRQDGEFHLLSPAAICSFQQAVRNNDPVKYREFADLVNDQKGHLCTLRSALKFKEQAAVAINEVESASEIVKRFVTGAMSYGSVSKEVHETIAIVMNRLGARSNSGEGGEDPARFKPLANGDSKRSAIKQVASGRFGVTSNYLVNADELQIKIAQGAKPGEGGQLPGHKVNAVIARIRYSVPGVTLISPPPHHDIYSIEDLAQLIFDLKNANPEARVSVKLVSETGVGTIAAGVAKGHADMILISGGDGGTGASPLSSIKHAGLPWELGLAETHQTLVLNNLRSRVKLQTDGQLRTGRDIVMAAILGADEFGFATPALMTMGCVMLRHCHLNNCSVGIATQDEALRKRFAGKPEYLENYLKFVAEEARAIMAQLGVRKIDELVGRTDLLEIDENLLNWKSKNIDYSKILFKPDMQINGPRLQDHGLKNVIDKILIEKCDTAIEKRQNITLEMTLKNHNRTVGTMLSSRISKKWGEEGLPDDTIRLKFKGSSGQSFGAFLAKGVTLELEGECNDYVGKGLSGGKIIVYPDRSSRFDAKENIVIGNTAFYGATGGDAYIRGIAGERFCVRNSGIYAVVEGIGDHGCEYMTGGRVAILGKTGRNFAAGMSGGIAYVYDIDGKFAQRCNTAMVELSMPSVRDESILMYLLENHYKYTRSDVAKKILDNFSEEIKRIIRVIPKEYKSILIADGTYKYEETPPDPEG
ncbi:MAG: glutamate synthase large subunit [Candidatus Saganbacteria bacterium]|nr:glutamate synthase large subunit [Candidatus Saganbacteria bacterium]